MNPKSLEMLEFPKVREMLAGYAAFSGSRDLARNLEPSPVPEAIVESLGRSAEARRLLALAPDFAVRGAIDVRGLVVLAARGRVLEPQELVSIQTTLAAARQARSGIRRFADELPGLWGIGDRLVELSAIEQEIGRTFAATGEVLDSASPRLATIRRQAVETRQRLLDRLDSILKSPRARKALQSPLVTEREGRYVLPLKAEARRELKGIVHDVSNTGATVFVEPLSTVETGNELRQLTIEEKREIERILAALSMRVGASEAEISTNVALLAELDLELAKARFAQRAKATEPAIRPASGPRAEGTASEAGVLRLVNARHPLLTGRAVPLSVEIGRDYSILVITGPNTGGKTVALKTVGLLAAMAQAGMPIPASEESCVPVFDGIYADIGDEQSIEQTLSTFSWHMGNIVRIMESSTENSLVLLDELGTSTDPNEGAALARAILLRFSETGNMVVATTHFSELKVFAHTTPGLRNASLDFDPGTLAPTYHLTMGIPGGSNALAIAARLGLPVDIIESAKRMMTEGSRELEGLLADLMAEKGMVEEVRVGLEEEKRAATDARARWEDELGKLRQREREEIREQKDRLASEAAELQREVRRATSDLKKARSQENMEQAQRALARVRERVGALNSQLKASQGGAGAESGEPGQVTAGDQVWLADVNTWGTVLAVREEEDAIEVQVGQTRVRLNLADAEKIRPPAGKRLPQPSMVTQRLSGRVPSSELDLRGWRADDAVAEVDRYLNDASLTNLGSVRIIHGHGTGALRRVVREMLASHSLVRSFRPGERGEGGDGVTVVTL